MICTISRPTNLFRSKSPGSQGVGHFSQFPWTAEARTGRAQRKAHGTPKCAVGVETDNSTHNETASTSLTKRPLSPVKKAATT